MKSISIVIKSKEESVMNRQEIMNMVISVIVIGIGVSRSGLSR